MGNSIQLQWTDSASILRTVTINISSIKYTITGSNIKVPAPTIKPYVIPMGYNNPTIDLTFTCNDTTYNILNTLTSDVLITATVNLSDFPEFETVSSNWYSDKFDVSRGQAYGTAHFNANIVLVKYYG